MTRTCLMHNTIVSVPTGMGKTNIAAVVLMNFRRWFPSGLAVFCAPTLALVEQQVGECGRVWGDLMRGGEVAVMTGKTHAHQRKVWWGEGGSKRIFFCTPQTVQNDLQTGLLDGRRVVLLVLDETHRASGDHSYVAIARHLRERSGAKFRTVGLSATPGGMAGRKANNSGPLPVFLFAASFFLSFLTARIVLTFCALLRILSITANIKAIQLVVDALRISRIDVRSEDDPSIAPYRHQTTIEEVIVQQTSLSRRAEDAVTNLVRPYVAKIRQAVQSSVSRHPGGGGGAAEVERRLAGDVATLSPYQILRTKQDLQKLDPELVERMQGYFIVSQTFLSIRDHLRSSGIGMVRKKLREMLTARSKGLMATVLKEEPFRKLCETVEGREGASSVAAHDGLGSGLLTQSVPDLLANNPKLSKLCEILTEHFERARAVECAQSDSHSLGLRAESTIMVAPGATKTRAIVFSQFRDSVAEIVLALKTLEPLVRPRHFIGQGKGSKQQQQEAPLSKLDSANDGALRYANGKILKGMTQAEQHQVIKEFTAGVYNTLVCTCIGEEGLDIGEVDLTVNFDNPTNPIRGIQRAGRTGRKREGRIVRLIYEGQEERSVRALKQKQRTLRVALQKAEKFQYWPSVPMLPAPPQRKDIQIHSTQRFHISQVEGHTSSAVRMKRKRTYPDDSCSSSEQWCLSEEEEGLRRRCFGALADVHIEIPTRSNHGFPPALLRFFLGARDPNVLSHREGRALKSSLGRSVQLLSQFEASAAVSSASSRTLPTRRLLHRFRGDPAVAQLFPASIAPNHGSESIADMFRRAQGDRGATCPSVARSTFKDNAENGMGLDRNQLEMEWDQNACGLAAEEVDSRQEPTSVEAFKARQREPGDYDLFVLPSPSETQSGSEDEESFSELAELQHAPEKQKFPSANDSDHVVGSGAPGEVNDDIFRLPSQDSASSEVLSVTTRCRQMPYLSKSAVPSFDEFRLSTDDESSRSSSADDDHLLGQADSQFDHLESRLLQLPNLHETPRSDDELFPHKKQVKRIQNRLAIHDSSQETSSAGSALPEAAIEGDRHGLPSEDNCRSFEVLVDTPLGHEPSFTEATIGRSAPMNGGEKCASRELKGTPLCALSVQQRTQIIGSIDALRDTPLASSGVCDRAPGTGNTSKSVDDIICAVCRSGTSPDEDPILLCDGPALGFPCSVAVHLSCYSIPHEALDHESWRCDPCAHYFNGGIRIACYACDRDETAGLLKRLDDEGTVWKHVGCQDERKRLRKIGNRKCGASSSAPATPGESLGAAATNKRLRGGSSRENRAAVQSRKLPPRRPLDDIRPNEAEADGAYRYRRAQLRRKCSPIRRNRYSRFLDLEAAIDSDEDVEGDDEEEYEIAALEAEEMEDMAGFINDSSQLGTASQEDELDRADPDAKGLESAGALHRACDGDRERLFAFATPALNRRHLRRAQRRQQRLQVRGDEHDDDAEDEEDDDDEDDDDHSGVPSSEKGLGKMYFIRSVLEHHRRGGDMNDVEEVYHELLAEQRRQEGVEESLDEWAEPPRPQPPAPVRFIAPACELSGSSEAED
jgi:Fanconi anemia group M protein